MTAIFFGCMAGFVAWFLVRYLAAGLFTVNQNERAVKTAFGRAERVGPGGGGIERRGKGTL
jgi:regulator of protease activity HflC (stomatin/prohibitin superfamily)